MASSDNSPRPFTAAQMRYLRTGEDLMGAVASTRAPKPVTRAEIIERARCLLERRLEAQRAARARAAAVRGLDAADAAREARESEERWEALRHEI